MPIRLLRPFGLAALLATVALPVPAQDAGPGDLAGAYLAARAADKAGDYTAVVEFGTRALEDDPDNTGLLEGLVMAHLGLGEIEAAIPPARHLSEIDGGNQIAGLVLLADAIRAEDWGAVDAFLEGGVTVGGLMDEMVRAWSAVGAGQMNEAIERFDALIEDGPAGQPALLQKALALALVGDYEGAAEILGGSEMVMRLNRGGVLAYIQVLSQLERNPDAAALLEEAYPETDDPELITLHDELVAGKPIPFTAVTSPRESIAQLFFEVGDSLRGETDPGLVLLYARIAGYLDPTQVGATLVAAQVLDEMGNHELAAQAYASVPESDPTWPQAQLGRAGALDAMGRIGDAIAVLTSAAKAHPDFAVLQAAIGDALRGEQRYAEATPYYDAAVALYDADRAAQWRVYFARGITFERQDMWDKAEADFRKALELSPDQPSVLNYLGYSYVEKRENFDEALDMIKRAVAARPYDGYIRDSLGWAYYRLGRYQEAVEEMERAVELLPLEPVLNDHLGDTFWAVGRTREARFQWRRALSFVDGDTDLDELNPDRIRQKLEVGLDAVLAAEGGEGLAQ
ncbi:MAG: tetratricopeptide repeat protein [Maritimibacter sp.]|nr:tetratricopeptide repeat protein [Maritimibacter sp.]